MTWIIIELLFLILPIVLPATLYRSNRSYMTKFYLRMTGSESARKLYVQSLLIFLLLYHYVYAGGHFGEWSIILSTIPCVTLFSFKRADNWLHKLHENKKGFLITSFLVLAICAIPHLHTMAVTLAFLLLAAMFYPSCDALAKWQNEEVRKSWKENPGTICEHYY